MSHEAWASEIREVDGELKEHVSFQSFVRKFGINNKDEAVSQYRRLLRSPRLKKTRLERLRAAFTGFMKGRLDSFWLSWDREQASQEFNFSCETAVKRTAILAHQASIAVSAQGFSAVQASSTITSNAQADEVDLESSDNGLEYDDIPVDASKDDDNNGTALDEETASILEEEIILHSSTRWSPFYELVQYIFHKIGPKAT
ncbi:hypothetical protein BGX20_007102 [Mortierella sp. AD010]|nr:hypothetical protein BGX20_007102 [Mortierella sp. AD010]